MTFPELETAVDALVPDGWYWSVQYTADHHRSDTREIEWHIYTARPDAGPGSRGCVSVLRGTPEDALNQFECELERILP